MDQTRENTIAILKDLLRICKDEQSLFQTASDKSKDSRLKKELLKYAREKEEYVLKLKSEIKRLGDSPDLTEIQNDGLAGATVKDAEYSANDLLQQCITKDSISIQRYSAAIKEDILWEVVPLVAKQYFGSINLHDQMLTYIKPVQKQTLQGVA